MREFKPMNAEFDEYRRDESRSQGEADTISFPTSEDELCAQLRVLAESEPPVPVTVQGARTGLAAGAVPHGGHVLNLSKMNAFLGLRRDEAGVFYLRVQPGVVLSELRRHLHAKTIPTTGWDEASLASLEELYAAPEQFFPTDPTETSACVGGMAACNASGARSYRYGPMRPHVSALRVALADGETLSLRRGEQRAHGRTLVLATEQGRAIRLDLPTYEMPHTKNASGYAVEDDMDALDLFIGSDGTLGVITELELVLMPLPQVVWGVNCFFGDEAAALDFVAAARPRLKEASAFEYFDGEALDILREVHDEGASFASLPAVSTAYGACVFVELECETEGAAMAALGTLDALLREAGAREEDTWVARTDVDRERQRLFRHAVPECVNMRIDRRRRTTPGITKLGSDMSVPDERLHDVMALYRRTIAHAGLESATWGHIGDNHLHVNILPRDEREFALGKELFFEWAREVTAMGGAVSAEHGVGKIKRDFLLAMYGEDHVREMASLKLQLDPAGRLGRGNLFDEAYLDAPDALARGEERA